MLMAQDSTSLDNLNDIVMPEAAPWWPPALGWYLLGGLLLAAVAWLIVAATRHWWRNRYRTAALAELEQLRRASGATADLVPTVAAINRLLKRVALSAWPRSEVASLAGDRWIAFLTQTGGSVRFSPAQTLTLRDIAYSSRISQQLTSAELQAIFDAAAQWIREHQPSANQTGTSV